MSLLDAAKARRDADAKRYAALDEDACQLCGAHGPDKRNLLVSCLYAVHEAVGEAIDLGHVTDVPEDLRRFYYLRICKACRGAFLGHLRAWANDMRQKRGRPMDHDGHLEPEGSERNIPVRIDGAVRWLTRDEYAAWSEQHRD